MSARTSTDPGRALRWRVMPATLTAVTAVLGMTAPAPHAAAGTTPMGASATNAYVANLGSGSVTPIDTATNTAGTPIPVGLDPYFMASTPNGKTLYVVSSARVTAISTATGKVKAVIRDIDEPGPIAITPNGRTAYVVNYVTATVIPINTATNRAGKPIPVGGSPAAIAITPGGKTAYVANRISVIPIDTATNTPGTAIPRALSRMTSRLPPTERRLTSPAGRAAR